MTLPDRNATLWAVTSAAAGESYDGPDVGADKWAGAADAYLVEKRDRLETAAGGVRAIDRVLVVETALGIDWRSGDVVTFSRTGEGDETATVQLVERADTDDVDIPADVQTTTITLETA